MPIPYKLPVYTRGEVVTLTSIPQETPYAINSRIVLEAYTRPSY
ncbi:hypothetical protein [Nostoc sp.]